MDKLKQHRVIIAGGRDFHNRLLAFKKIDKIIGDIPKEELMIVEGGANGADRLGRKWAERINAESLTVNADWETHGNSAGYIRNKEMAEISTQLIAFWDGKSKGTKHMIDLAEKEGLKVDIVKIKKSWFTKTGGAKGYTYIEDK